MNADRDLHGYLTGQFADADLLGQTDEQAAVDGVTPSTAAAYRQVLEQGQAALAAPRLDWRRMADSANRNFSDEQAAREWLAKMMALLAARLKQIS